MDFSNLNIEQVKAIVLTGAIAGGVGGLFWKSISYFQSLFIWIYRRIIHKITIELDYGYHDVYNAIDHWCLKNREKNIRNYILSSFIRDERKFVYSFKTGVQFLFIKKNLLKISKYRVKLENATKSNEKIYEEYFIIEAFLNKKVIYDWLEKITNEYLDYIAETGNLYVQHNVDDYCLLKRIEFDDLVGDSPKKLKSLLLNKASQNILLEGPPGNGKTRSIAASAFLLKKNIKMINLNTIKEESLMSIYRNTEKGGILVFEEIDCVNASLSRGNNAVNKVQMESSNRVTLSTLLNIFDGLITRDDITLILTTNHMEKLDPALIRAGRIHKIIHFGPPTESELKELFSRNKIEWNPEYLELKSFAEAQAKVEEIINPLVYV